MITFFNRKELCTTYSMKEQAEIRKVLAHEGIPYRIKTRYHLPSHQLSIGPAEADPDRDYEYTFFVKRKDHEEAVYLLDL